MSGELRDILEGIGRIKGYIEIIILKRLENILN